MLLLSIMRNLVMRAIASVLFAIFSFGAAQADTFPSRPVRLVVPYAAGGTGDIVARVVADRLGPELGVSVVVENRPGATGAIAINPHWSKGIGYDPDRDLAPIALATIVPLALVVPGKAPYDSVAAMLKGSHERGLTFASAGTATPGHFAGEVLKARTGADLTHVPYKGASPALNDLIGAHVDLFFSGFPAALPHVKSGALKLLAVSSGKRSGLAPDVPTVA